MNPFEAIEKIINEHGSAAILKERLSLAANQYAVLEQKLAVFQAKVTGLESKIVQLELDNAQKNEQIRGLEKKIVQKAAQDMEKVKEEILQVIASQPKIRAQSLASVLNVHAEVALFHIEELERLKFIHGAYNTMHPPEWTLAQAGREYLICHGLLS